MAETWRQRHHRATREELLAVARGIMLEEGIDGLGVRELARRTGFGPASLYTYFSGKDEILAAITAESSRELEEYLDRVPADVAPVDRLVGLCGAYLDFAAENPADLACIVEAGLRGGVASAAASGSMDSVRQRLGETLRACLAPAPRETGLGAEPARPVAASAADSTAADADAVADAEAADAAVGMWAELHGRAVLSHAGHALPAGDAAEGVVRRGLAALGVGAVTSR